MYTNSPLPDRSRIFSARILKLVTLLPHNLATRSILNQIIRSGTSVGANIQEAQAAESRADFIHKMHIAFKEARETRYWLSLIQEAKWTQDPLLSQLDKEASELAAILAKSLITAKQNAQKNS